MTIRYSLTLGELMTWFFARLQHHRQSNSNEVYFQWLMLIIFACLVAFSVRVSHVFPLDPGKSVDPADYFALAGPFLGMLAPLVLTFWFVLRHVTVSIDSKGLAFKHPATRVVDVPWRDVTVLENDAQSIIIGSKFPRVQATHYAIPKRAFASAADAQAFFDSATAYREQAVGRQFEVSAAWPPAPKPPAR